MATAIHGLTRVHDAICLCVVDVVRNGGLTQSNHQLMPVKAVIITLLDINEISQRNDQRGGLTCPVQYVALAEFERKDKMRRKTQQISEWIQLMAKAKCSGYCTQCVK